MDKRKYQLGVLGSGKGSNLGALARACAAGDLNAHITLVISDVENAGILPLAAGPDIPAQFIPPGPFRTKLDEAAEMQYIEALRAAEVDVVVLAGFMRILKGNFLRAFPGKVVNIHPSLLPSFPGLDAWKQALEYGVKVTGCTVHLVDQGIDTGPILGQRTVPIEDADTPESLHQRIQQAEWKLYPQAIRALMEPGFEFTGRRAISRRP